MPGDDERTKSMKVDATSTKEGVQKDASRPSRSLFSIPPPLKQLFDRTPLRTYEANPLPLRTSTRRSKHRLHVFVTQEDALLGRPSYNPSCLKWQTFLRLNNVDFVIVSSNNHASPAGALPFLLPATSDHGLQSDPIPASRLRRWCEKESGTRDSTDTRADLYTSLIDHRLRMAWLFQLYLTPANTNLCHRLYVQSSSSNPFVQAAIARHLQNAAKKELVNARATETLDEMEIMQDAEEALSALSTLLGQDEWFFGRAYPTLFDASLFAYTQLILDQSLGWDSNKLRAMLEERPNLTQHRERLRERCFDIS